MNAPLLLDAPVPAAAPPVPSTPSSPTRPARPRRRLVGDPWLALILAGTAVLYLWDLDVSRWANPYYSAAAQAGAESWKAFLFGSLDAGNAITVDKPPLALWPMALSVRLFGLSPWSVLVPQAIEGVVAVALMHACVRHTTRSRAAAAVAAVAFALTPVCTLMFRYDNPDALMTTLLLGAALCVLKAGTAVRPHRLMAAAGALVGLAFLTKMLEAVLVLPAMLAAFQVYGPGRWRGRLAAVAASVAAAVVAAGWWVVLVELWPASSRPYVGGSTTNSVVDLTLGYNGVSRISGTSANSLGANGILGTNLARIARTDIGAEFLWLVPTTIVLAAVCVWFTWRDSARPVRLAWTMWWGWLACGTVTFAAMAGIFHSYYTILLAPAVCALLGTSVRMLWDARHHPAARRATALAGVAATLTAVPTFAIAGGATVLWSLPVAVLCCWPAASYAVSYAARSAADRRRRPTTRVALASVVAGALLGPAVFSVTTAALPHNGSGPMSGPGRGSPTTALLMSGVDPSTHLLVSRPLDPALVDLLRDGGRGYRWSAAVPGARSSSALELASGRPMLTIGGYNGSDPFPTVADLASLVEAHQVRYLVLSGTGGPAASAAVGWALAHYPVDHTPDGTSVIDLQRPAR